MKIIFYFESKRLRALQIKHAYTVTRLQVLEEENGTLRQALRNANDRNAQNSETIRNLVARLHQKNFPNQS